MAAGVRLTRLLPLPLAAGSSPVSLTKLPSAPTPAACRRGSLLMLKTIELVEGDLVEAEELEEESEELEELEADEEEL